MIPILPVSTYVYLCLPMSTQCVYLHMMAQSAKWRVDSVPRNCILPCSYVDVLSEWHGHIAGIRAQCATETDGESGVWQWRVSVAEWRCESHDATFSWRGSW